MAGAPPPLKRRATADTGFDVIESPQEGSTLPQARVDDEDDKNESSPLLKRVDSYLNATFGKEKPLNSELQTIILLVNSAVGSGILNQPYVFKEAGIGSALVVYCVAALATWVGLVFLVEASHRTDTSDYGGLATAVLGPWGGYAADVAMLVNTYGALCSYLVAICGLCSSMISGWTDSSSAFTSNVFITLVVGVLLAPLCLSRHYGSLVMPATYSIFAISIVVLVVVAYGPLEGKAYASDALEWWTARGAFQESGSIFFALACAHATFHAHSSMADKSLATWIRVTAVSVSISTVLCAVTGLLGYLSFRSATTGEILDNFTSAGSAAFKVLVVLHLILYIPPDFCILRFSALNLCYKHPDAVHTLVHVGSTVWLLVSVIGLVALLYVLDLTEGQAFDYLISLTGATAATITSFLLPGAIAVGVYGLEGYKGKIGASLCFLGAVVVVSVPVLLFT